MEYPEHEKMKAIQPETQTIGNFLGWLTEDKEVILAMYPRKGVGLCETFYPKDKLLEEYFDIDPIKVETEKRLMLEEMRSNEAG